MPLRTPKGARRYNDRVDLIKTAVSIDDYGVVSFGAPTVVAEAFAEVLQMSSTKTMMTFQQADIVGVDIEMRNPMVEFDSLVWRGRTVHFPKFEDVNNRGRIIRIQGWYQIDNPAR